MEEGERICPSVDVGAEVVERGEEQTPAGEEDQIRRDAIENSDAEFGEGIFSDSGDEGVAADGADIELGEDVTRGDIDGGRTIEAPADGEEDVEGGDRGEEGQDAQVSKNIMMPTQEETDKQMVTHIPYRRWCSHCVRGRQS